MPSTYTCLLYHLIFSTKHRELSIAPDIRARVHEYLGGAVPGLGDTPQGVGGVADHVHLLVGLTSSHRIKDFLRDVKKSSSVWLSDTVGVRGFAWQEGYAAFTVSASVRPSLQDYIANQEEHHRH